MLKMSQCHFFFIIQWCKQASILQHLMLENKQTKSSDVDFTQVTHLNGFIIEERIDSSVSSLIISLIHLDPEPRPDQRHRG